MNRSTLLTTWWVVAAVTVWAVGIGMPPAVASDPDIEDRKVVSYGPLDVAVHEVGAAAWELGGPKVVAMWMSGASRSSGPMYYAVSADGAQTWGATQELTLPENTSHPADPSVAVSPDGTFVATLLADPELALNRVYATRMASEADVFEQATLIESEMMVDFPRVVAGPGPGAQTWFYIFCHTMSDLFYTRSADDGQTWAGLQPVQVDGQDVVGWGAAPGVRPDDGTIYLAYGYGDPPGPYFLRLLESTDNALTYSHLTGLNEQITSGYYDEFVPGAFRVPGFGAMAIDPNDPNNLYLVFNDLAAPPDPQTGDGDLDVYLLRSTDGGQTWAQRQRINQDTPQQDPEHYDQFMAAINVDSAGGVHITWYDTRKDHPAADYPYPFDIELYYAWSSNNGETFAEELVGKAIDTGDLLAPEFIGDYNALTSAGNLVIPVYMGTRDPESIPGGPRAPGGPKQLDETIFSNRIVHPPP